MRRFPFVSLLNAGMGLALCFSFPLQAQNRVNIGAVEKYTGLPISLNDVRSIDAYLVALEAQVAKEALRLHGINYVDRTNTAAIFREARLTTDTAFDPSSGGLRGLLGRLDLLIVIDATSDRLARIRAIDLESGSVRALESCKRGLSLFGDSSDGAPECVKVFVTSLQSVASDVTARKRQREMKEANERSKHEAEAKEAAVKRSAEQQRNAERFAIERRKTEEERHQAEQQAHAEAEAEARQEEAVRSEIASLLPSFEDAQSRLEAANSFWETLRNRLASQGHPLRAQVMSTLTAANRAADRCKNALDNRRPQEARVCIADMNRRIDQLEDYK